MRPDCSIKRIHLFEFCDQAWLPDFIREGFMDCLAIMYRSSHPYKGFSDYILKHLTGNIVYDLATGTGESAEFFLKFLKKHHADKDIKVIGTDLFPNKAVLEQIKQEYPHFDYIGESVDAFDPPQDNIKSSYLMFTAFHHFKPNDAAKLIQSCLSKGSSLTIFEFTSRTSPFGYIFSLLSFVFLIPVPFFAKKKRWQKFVFSLLIPIIPLMVGFDGVVSNLRTYTETDLRRLVQSISPEQDIQMDFQERRYGIFFKSYMCRFYL